jgi:uncharacterized RDD family membrane protein YckC
MYPETSAVQLDQDLFTEEDLNQYQEASNGQRFLNLLIDVLLMRYVLSWGVGYVLGMVLAKFFPEFLIAILDEGFEYYLISYIISALTITLYYTICEKLFNGYTLGKIITGTRAIRENGEELRFKDALLRSLCRLVPFEWFSGFGYRPWHDTWTNTVVVKTR